MPDSRIVSSFFPGLPWDEKPKLAANTITIDRKADKTASAEDGSRQADKAALASAHYFSALPWAVKTQALAPGSLAELDAEGSAQSGIASTSSTGSTFADLSVQPTNSFFADAPWDQPKAKSSNIQGDKPSSAQNLGDQQVAQLETTQAASLSKPLAGYFQTLPWQGKDASKNTGSGSGTSPGGEGIPGIFAAATQSALHASKKGKNLESQAGHKKTDK